MDRYFAILFLCAVACGGSSPVAESTTAGTTQDSAAQIEPLWELRPGHASTLYGNDTGVRVAVVPVSKRDEPQETTYVLVRATGTTSKYDGLVLLGRRERTKRYHYVAVNLRGEPVKFLSHVDGSPVWFFTGYDGIKERRDELQSIDEPVDGKLVVRLREEQRSVATRSIEATTRAERKRWQEEIFEGYKESLLGSCPGVKASIDWSTVSDELLERTRIASRCETLLRVTNDFCEQHPLQVERLAKEMALVCEFEGDPAESKAKVTVGPNGVLRYTAGQGGHGFRAILNTLRAALDLGSEVIRGGGWTFVVRYGESDSTMYSGKGTSFYGASTVGDSNPRTFRLAGGAVSGYVERRDGKWLLVCGDEHQELEVLPRDERDAVLSAATFEETSKWKREPHFLSRDSHGTYYYVDRYRKVFGGKRYRVFVGRRGQLTLTKLKGVVEDSEGTVFSTDSGDLRLIISNGTKSAIWIRGRKQTQLTPVAIRANLGLIYDELGVYYGADTGFVCE